MRLSQTKEKHAQVGLPIKSFQMLESSRSLSLHGRKNWTQIVRRDPERTTRGKIYRGLDSGSYTLLLEQHALIGCYIDGCLTPAPYGQLDALQHQQPSFLKEFDEIMSESTSLLDAGCAR